MLASAGWDVEQFDRGSTERIVARLKACKPDVVFHLASLFVSDHRVQDVQNLVESNLLFGTQLLEAMAQAGVKRIINTGTSWQCPHPFNLYAATKQAFESILGYYVST